MTMEVPPHIVPPDSIEFKISEMDPTQMGAWTTKSIPSGTFLGPYVGDIVRDGDEKTINFRFSWEIFNLENGEYLYTINATDPAHGNWMRYVNCARYLEEQNLVSVQKDMEMFYKAIKDIEPGEELLTWYQPFKKRRKKKMRSPLKTQIQSASPSMEEDTCTPPPEENIIQPSEDGIILGKRQRVKKKMYDDIILMSDLIPKRRRRSKAEIQAEKEAAEINELNQEGLEGVPKKRRRRKKKSLDENETGGLPIKTSDSNNTESSSVGQKMKGRKKSTELPVFTGSGNGDSPSDLESSGSSERLKQTKCDALISKPKTSEEIKQIAEIEASWKYPGQGQEYQFEHLIHFAVTKNGRRFYKCDVCSGIYRHTFSLKRHYLRNHINCCYLSKADLANCLVVPAQQWLDIKHANDEKMMSRCIAKLESGTFLSDKYDDQVDVATPGLYRCCICNKLFDVLQNLIEHTQDHPATPHVKFFGCDQCKMRFTFHQNLLRHKLVHEDSRQKIKKKKDKNPPATMGHFNQNDIHGKPYKCRLCPMKFRYQSNLEKHHKIHTADRPFDCSICGKSFPNETNLKKHMVIHVGSSVHCKYCIQKFNHVGTLRKHIRLEHPVKHKERMLNLLEGRDQGESDAANKIRKSLKLLRKDQSEFSANKKEQNNEKVKIVVKKEEKTTESQASYKTNQQTPGHSKFKFSCVVCKKRFSAYVNMCRHRRMAHRDFKESATKDVEKSELENKVWSGKQEEKTKPVNSIFGKNEKSMLKPKEMEKKQDKEIETKQEDTFIDNSPETIQEFYANVADNIADNLNCYIDGGLDSLSNYRSYINIEDYDDVPEAEEEETTEEKKEVKWEEFNFPPNYDPKFIYENFQYIENKYNDGMKKEPDKLDKSVLEELAPALCTRRRSSSEWIALADFSKNDSNHGESPLVKDNNETKESIHSKQSSEGKKAKNMDLSSENEESKCDTISDEKKSVSGTVLDNVNGSDSDNLDTSTGSLVKQGTDVSEVKDSPDVLNKGKDCQTKVKDSSDILNKDEDCLTKVKDSSDVFNKDEDCQTKVKDSSDVLNKDEDCQTKVKESSVDSNVKDTSDIFRIHVDSIEVKDNSHVPKNNDTPSHMQKVKENASSTTELKSEHVDMKEKTDYCLKQIGETEETLKSECTGGHCEKPVAAISNSGNGAVKTFELNNKPGDAIKHADQFLIDRKKKVQLISREQCIAMLQKTTTVLGTSVNENTCQTTEIPRKSEETKIDMKNTSLDLCKTDPLQSKNFKLTSVLDDKDIAETLLSMSQNSIDFSINKSPKQQSDCPSASIDGVNRNLDTITNAPTAVKTEINVDENQGCNNDINTLRDCNVEKTMDSTDKSDKSGCDDLKNIPTDNISNEVLPTAGSQTGNHGNNCQNLTGVYKLDASELIQKLAKEVNKYNVRDICKESLPSNDIRDVGTVLQKVVDGVVLSCHQKTSENCDNHGNIPEIKLLLNDDKETNETKKKCGKCCRTCYIEKEEMKEKNLNTETMETSESGAKTILTDEKSGNIMIAEREATNEVIHDENLGKNLQDEEKKAINVISLPSGEKSEDISKNETNGNEKIITQEHVETNKKSNFTLDGSMISESSGVMSIELFTDSENESDEIFTGLALSKRNSVSNTQDIPLFTTGNEEYTDHSPFHNYEEIEFGKNGTIFHVCSVCKKQFEDLDRLFRHQWKKHPSIHCHYLQVEQGHEIEYLYYTKPCNRGVLGVTGKALERVSDRGSYTCTRCAGSFKSVDRLRIHIINCAPKVEGTESSESKPKYRKRYRKHQKIMVKSEPNSPAKVKREIVPVSNSGNSSETLINPKKQYLLGPRNMKKDLNTEKMNNTASVCRRKKSMEMAYNPHNHIRRRELTELLDTHQCRGCGVKFKSISLLERHVKKCDGKDKIRDLKVMKSNVNDTFHQKLKHCCLHCNRGFSYPKTLMNHYKAFCLVKKDKVLKGLLTEHDKQQELVMMNKLKQQEEDRCFTEIPNETEKGKKGWPRGMKRKWRRKNHCWTYIKKRKPSTEDKAPNESTDCMETRTKIAVVETSGNKTPKKLENIKECSQSPKKMASPPKQENNGGSIKKINMNPNGEVRQKRKYIRKKIFTIEENKKIRKRKKNLADSLQSVIECVSKGQTAGTLNTKVNRKNKFFAKVDKSNQIVVTLVNEVSSGKKKRKLPMGKNITKCQNDHISDGKISKNMNKSTHEDGIAKPVKKKGSNSINTDKDSQIQSEKSKILFNPMKKMRIMRKQMSTKFDLIIKTHPDCVLPQENKPGPKKKLINAKTDFVKKMDLLLKKIKAGYKIPIRRGISDIEVQKKLTKAQRIKIKKELNEVKTCLMAEVDELCQKVENKKSPAKVHKTKSPLLAKTKQVAKGEKCVGKESKQTIADSVNLNQSKLLQTDENLHDSQSKQVATGDKVIENQLHKMMKIEKFDDKKIKQVSSTTGTIEKDMHSHSNEVEKVSKDELKTNVKNSLTEVKISNASPVKNSQAICENKDKSDKKETAVGDRRFLKGSPKKKVINNIHSDSSVVCDGKTNLTLEDIKIVTLADKKIVSKMKPFPSILNISKTSSKIKSISEIDKDSNILDQQESVNGDKNNHLCNVNDKDPIVESVKSDDNLCLKKDDNVPVKKRIPIYNQDAEVLKSTNSPSKKLKESKNSPSKTLYLKPVDSTMKKKLELAGHIHR